MIDMKNLQNLLANQVEENLKNNIKVWNSKTIGEYKVSELNEEDRNELNEYGTFLIQLNSRVWDVAENNNSIEILAM
jgi:RecJ-like exonuclease